MAVERVVLSTCAGLSLLVGCSYEDDPPDPAPPLEGQPLRSQVEQDVSPQTLSLFEHSGRATMRAARGASPRPVVAAWDATSGTLVVLSAFLYSSSCPPQASAAVEDSGEVTVRLDDYDGEGACTADAARVTVLVDGLGAPPSRLSWLDSEKSLRLPVVNRG